MPTSPLHSTKIGELEVEQLIFNHEVKSGQVIPETKSQKELEAASGKELLFAASNSFFGQKVVDVVEMRYFCHDIGILEHPCLQEPEKNRKEI